MTRTTIPTRLESLFILPRNIGYHIEHHWYPSVPFYRLPELHDRLLQVPGYRLSANIKRSVFHSLAECTRSSLSATLTNCPVHLTHAPATDTPARRSKLTDAIPASGRTRHGTRGASTTVEA